MKILKSSTERELEILAENLASRSQSHDIFTTHAEPQPSQTHVQQGTQPRSKSNSTDGWIHEETRDEYLTTLPTAG